MHVQYLSLADNRYEVLFPRGFGQVEKRTDILEAKLVDEDDQTVEKLMNLTFDEVEKIIQGKFQQPTLH